jgi:hypothetical protein
LRAFFIATECVLDAGAEAGWRAPAFHVDVEHVAFEHQPVAEIRADEQQRPLVPVHDLRAARVDELGVGLRREQQRKRHENSHRRL